MCHDRSSLVVMGVGDEGRTKVDCSTKKVGKYSASPHRSQALKFPLADWTLSPVFPILTTPHHRCLPPAVQTEIPSKGTRTHQEISKPAYVDNSPSLLTMALNNVGSIVLNILIFITTLVNFSYALTALEPLTLIFLYAISKIFVTAPEEGIFAKCNHRHLYPDG